MSVYDLYKVLVREYDCQNPTAAESPRRDVLGQANYVAVSDAIKEEMPKLADQIELKKKINSRLVDKFYTWLHNRNVARAALCFSGGGIRSATFGLGVLQGLARQGLLDKFDYLSTVSGGGYLGGWLSAWIYRRGLHAVQLRLQNPASRKSALQPEPEPVQHLRAYSNYMSPKVGLLSADTWTLAAIYFRNLLLNWLVLFPLLMIVLLIPRLCAWAVRLVPPVPVRQGIFWLGVACGIGAIAYIYANRPSLADAHLRDEPKHDSVFPNEKKDQSSFLLYCWLPLVVLSACVTTFYAWLDTDINQQDFIVPFLGRISSFWAFVLLGIMLHLGGRIVSFLWLRRFNPWESLIAALAGGLGGALTWLVAANVFPNPQSVAEVSAYVCYATPLFLLMFLLSVTLFIGLGSNLTTDPDREWLARAGGWMLIAIMSWSVVSSVVVFGPALLAHLGPRLRTLATSAGVLSGIATLVFGGSTKSPANKKEEAKGGMSQMLAHAALSLAALLFAATILIALSLLTAWLVAKLFPFFGFLAERIFARPHVAPLWHTQHHASFDRFGLLDILFYTPGRVLVGLLLLLAAIGLVASWLININEFSLHAAYRNRLIRAYLGASRSNWERKPNPFTGLDEYDDVEMWKLNKQRYFDASSFRDLDRLVAALRSSDHPLSPYVERNLSPDTKEKLTHYNPNIPPQRAELQEALIHELNRLILGPSILPHAPLALQQDPAVLSLLEEKTPPETPLLNRLLLEIAFRDELTWQICKPLHVVNMTLNLVGGDSLAWQNRKGESFTVSALHSGSYSVGYRDSRKYGGAIKLGTAVAISGAAASPNMGYHSSPLVTFLMTLFNVRLGWWLGNPGKAGYGKYGTSTFDLAGPRFAFRPILSEAFGMTTDQNPYVYLSDGGHFENLGLYEMIIRRCRFIIVCDGSADPEYNFEGLANAVSKIRVDLGVPISFTPEKLVALKPGGEGEKSLHSYCALGRICYSAVDQRTTPGRVEDGFLLYVKASLNESEPIDVYNYKQAHDEFPHESTADQMYSEEQFESYRALGSHAIDYLCDKLTRPTSLEDFFRQLEKKFDSPPDC
jgi:hypothetical protein